MSFSDSLRELATAMENGEGPAQVLVLARSGSGTILSDDNGLTLTEAAYLARDFTIWVAQQVQRAVLLRRGRRCHGGAHGR